MAELGEGRKVRPIGPKCLHFDAVFGENRSNSRLAPSGESWICHWQLPPVLMIFEHQKKLLVVQSLRVKPGRLTLYVNVCTNFLLFQFATYAAAVLFTAVLGGYKCLGDTYILITGSHPSVMDYVGEIIFCSYEQSTFCKIDKKINTGKNKESLKVTFISALTLLAVGLSALKLSISHQCHLKWSKQISVVILVLAFTVMHLQPDLSFEG